MALAGSILILIGIAAERSGEPAFDYLFLGIALGLVGILLWNKLRTRAEQPSRRFSLFRKREEKKKDERKRRGSREDIYYD